MDQNTPLNFTEQQIEAMLRPFVAEVTRRIADCDAKLEKAFEHSNSAYEMLGLTAPKRPPLKLVKSDTWSGAMTEFETPRVDPFEVRDVANGHTDPAELKKAAADREAQKWPALPADLRDPGIFGSVTDHRSNLTKVAPKPAQAVMWDTGLATFEMYGQKKADVSDLGKIKI